MPTSHLEDKIERLSNRIEDQHRELLERLHALDKKVSEHERFYQWVVGFAAPGCFIALVGSFIALFK